MPESTIDEHPEAHEAQDVSEDIRRVISALENKDPKLVQQETFSEQRVNSTDAAVHFTPAVKKIFNHSIKYDYFSKNSNIAQIDIFSRKKTRQEQMDLIDDIREYLALPAPNISSNDHDQDRAIILYGVMKAIQEDLQKEFRWTKIFGTQSRLEIVLKEDMDAIKENFPNADFSDNHAKQLMKAHITDPKILQECQAALGHTKPPATRRST